MRTSKTSGEPFVDLVGDDEDAQRWMIWSAVMRALRQVRPYTDFEEFSRFEPIVTEADLDAFEFEQLMTAVADESGIRVPASDYPLVVTLDGLERYLLTRVSSSS